MNLKGYTFKTKEDFIYYLRQLLILTAKNLETYEKQINDLGSYIEERNLIERPKRVVSADTYNNYRSMIGYTGNYLANLFGDQAEYGCSYQNYRRNIKKKGQELNIAYLEFSQDQEEELNKVTSARNWGNHVPVSLIHSTIEKAFAVEIDTGKPIYIAEFERYEGLWLVSLYEEGYRNLQGYKGLFELMKEDYSKLTGNPCIIVKNNHPVRDMSDLVIPKISFGIQKKEIKTIEDVQRMYLEEE